MLVYCLLFAANLETLIEINIFRLSARYWRFNALKLYLEFRYNLNTKYSQITVQNDKIAKLYWPSIAVTHFSIWLSPSFCSIVSRGCILLLTGSRSCSLLLVSTGDEMSDDKFAALVYTVESSFNDISLYIISSIVSDILWLQLLPHC